MKKTKKTLVKLAAGKILELDSNFTEIYFQGPY